MKLSIFRYSETPLNMVEYRATYRFQVWIVGYHNSHLPPSNYGPRHLPHALPTSSSDLGRLHLEWSTRRPGGLVVPHLRPDLVQLSRRSPFNSLNLVFSSLHHHLLPVFAARCHEAQPQCFGWFYFLAVTVVLFGGGGRRTRRRLREQEQQNPQRLRQRWRRCCWTMGKMRRAAERALSPRMALLGCQKSIGMVKADG